MSGILKNYLAGWEHLEAVVLATVATGQNPLILGKHGAGKSSLVRFLNDALNTDGKMRFRRYSMDKENVTSMIGIPNVEDLKAGKMTFAKHERSIFNADVILLDEITRAPKESQNLVLEILEEKTCFGMPLGYKYAIGTANDETYQGAFKMDAALLDRFFVVIPSPTTCDEKRQFGPEEIKLLINLNMGTRDTKKYNPTLRKIIIDIQNAYKDFWGNVSVLKNVIDFSSKFFSILIASLKDISNGQKIKIYISQRDIGYQFCRVLLSCAAYYKTQTNIPDYLQAGAKDAIEYSLATKLGIPLQKMLDIFDQIKEILSDKVNEISRIKIALTTGSTADKIAGLKANLAIIIEKLEPDEIINIGGNIIQSIDIDSNQSNEELSINKKNLIDLNTILQSSNDNNVAMSKVRYKAKLRTVDILLPSGKLKEVMSWK